MRRFALALSTLFFAGSSAFAAREVDSQNVPADPPTLTFTRVYDSSIEGQEGQLVVAKKCLRDHSFEFAPMMAFQPTKVITKLYVFVHTDVDANKTRQKLLEVRSCLWPEDLK